MMIIIIILMLKVIQFIMIMRITIFVSVIVVVTIVVIILITLLVTGEGGRRAQGEVPGGPEAGRGPQEGGQARGGDRGHTARPHPK